MSYKRTPLSKLNICWKNDVRKCPFLNKDWLGDVSSRNKNIYCRIELIIETWLAEWPPIQRSGWRTRQRHATATALGCGREHRLREQLLLGRHRPGQSADPTDADAAAVWATAPRGSRRAQSSAPRQAQGRARPRGAQLRHGELVFFNDIGCDKFFFAYKSWQWLCRLANRGMVCYV